MTTLRALCDTNVFISYLLLKSDRGPIAAIVGAAFRRVFTPLLPEDLLHELILVAGETAHLATRISPEDVASLVQELLEVAELLPALGEAVPQVSRDPKDDYLLAHALVGRADYLVTGDRDLLVLAEVEGVKIVSPTEFAKILEARAS